MLASLIKQIYSCRPNTPETVEQLNEYKDRGERPGIPALEDALIVTLDGFSAVHIVIDALDECPTMNGERKYLLASLARILAAAPDNFHLFCASRKEPDIEAAIGHLLDFRLRTCINLTTAREVLNHDISLYIDSELKSDDFRSLDRDPETKRRVRETLLEKSDGM